MTTVKKIISTRGQGLNIPIKFNTQNSDLDMESDLKRYDQEILDYIINPERDYEVVKFRHEPVNGDETLTLNLEGIDYRDFGFDQEELIDFSKAVKKSFYKLDYYDELGKNKKKKMTKIIPMSLSRDFELTISTAPVSKLPPQTVTNYVTVELEYTDPLTGNIQILEVGEEPVEVYAKAFQDQPFFREDINSYFRILNGDVSFQAEYPPQLELCSINGDLNVVVDQVTLTISTPSNTYTLSTTGPIVYNENNFDTFVFDNISSGAPYDTTTNQFEVTETGDYEIELSITFDQQNATPDSYLRTLFFQQDTFDFARQPYFEESYFDNGNNIPETYTYNFTVVNNNSGTGVWNVGDKISFLVNPIVTRFDFYELEYKNFSDEVKTLTATNQLGDDVTYTLNPFGQVGDSVIVCVKVDPETDENGKFTFNNYVTKENGVINMYDVAKVTLSNNTVVTIDYEEPTLYDTKMRLITPQITSNRYKDSELYNLYYYNETIDGIDEFYVSCRFFNGKTGEVIQLYLENEEFFKCVLNRENRTYQYKTLDDVNKPILNLSI